MSTKLVPFSVDAYKPGDKVVTRNGLSVNIYTTKRPHEFCVVGDVVEKKQSLSYPKTWDINGNFLGVDGHYFDLFIEKVAEYVPFDELDFEKVIGKVVRLKTGTSFYLIVSAFNMCLVSHFRVGSSVMPAKFLLDNYTFLDGSPCGKLA